MTAAALSVGTLTILRDHRRFTRVRCAPGSATMRLVMHPLDPIRLCDLTPEARRQERAWRASVRSGDLIATPAQPATVIGGGG